jgi:predicted secreted protein
MNLKIKGWPQMFRSFVKVTSLSLILISTFFLIKGGIGLSAKDIFELSATPYGGYNDKLVQNLAQQKSDTIIGFVLMIFSFVLSLIDMLMPMSWNDLQAVNRKGLIAAIIFSIIVLFVAYTASCYSQGKYYKEVQKIRATFH